MMFEVLRAAVIIGEVGGLYSYLLGIKYGPPMLRETGDLWGPVSFQERSGIIGATPARA